MRLHNIAIESFLRGSIENFIPIQCVFKPVNYSLFGSNSMFLIVSDYSKAINLLPLRNVQYILYTSVRVYLWHVVSRK